MFDRECNRIKRSLVIDIPKMLEILPKKWRSLWNSVISITFDETIIKLKGRVHLDNILKVNHMEILE